MEKAVWRKLSLLFHQVILGGLHQGGGSRFVYRRAVKASAWISQSDSEMSAGKMVPGGRVTGKSSSFEGKSRLSQWGPRNI